MSISATVQDVEIFLGKNLQVWVSTNVNGTPLPSERDVIAIMYHPQCLISLVFDRSLCETSLQREEPNLLVWGIRTIRADDARSKTEVDSFVFAGNGVGCKVVD